jgi:DNA-binding transcriptional LysR family regulator
MTLSETLAFVTVVAAGSFTEAGRRLGVPKSTLSRQVTRLEERLGARLLQRTTRKLATTETGTAYYERCRDAIEAIAEAERVAQDVSSRARGTLRVSAPFDLGRDYLAALLPRFRAEYPEIELVLVLSQERVDLVTQRFDVAVRGGELRDAGFVSRKLVDSEILLCASPEYLDRRGRPRTIEALAEHDAVVMTSADGDMTWRLQGESGMVQLPLRPWLAANEWGVLRSALLDGLGVGPMLASAVAADLAAHRLEHVLPAYSLRGGGLYAIYPSRHHLSPKVRVFVDFLARHLSTAKSFSG